MIARMVGSEWYKVLANRIFWGVLLILMLANGICFYYYNPEERSCDVIKGNKKEYASFLIEYEQTEEHEKNAFLNEKIEQGEGYIDSLEQYFAEDLLKQRTYILNYDEFKGKMQERKKSLLEKSIYQDMESFSYKNILKTTKDYETLSCTGKDLKEGNNSGLLAISEYQLTMFSLCALAFFLCFIHFREEREQKTNQLLRTTAKGRLSLALIKSVVLCMEMVVFGSLIVGMPYIMTGYLYGFGDTARLIQSVPDFRNCIYGITIQEFLNGTFGIWIVFGVLVCLQVAVVFQLFANSLMSYLVSIVLLIVQGFGFYQNMTDHFLGIKEVGNLFYLTNIKSMISEYQNLEVFGLVWNKNLCSAMFLVLLFLLQAVLVLRIYANGEMEIKTEGLLQNIKERIFKNRRMTGSSHITSAELYKFFIEDKKIIFCMLLIAIVVIQIKEVNQKNDVYVDARQAVYHSYMKTLQGEITEEKIEYLCQESQLFEEENRRYYKMQEKGKLQKDGKSLEQIELEFRLEVMYPGFQMVQEQFEWLKDTSNNILGEKLIDEYAYCKEVSDYKQSVWLYVLGTILLVFMVARIVTIEYENGVVNMLRATCLGRETLFFVKYGINILATIFVFGMIYLSKIYAIYNIDGMRNVDVVLNRFYVSGGFAGTMTIRQFLVLLFLVRLFLFLFISTIAFVIAVYVRNQIYVIAGVVCTMILPGAYLCYRSRWDFGSLVFSGNCMYVYVGMIAVCMAGIFFLLHLGRKRFCQGDT